MKARLILIPMLLLGSACSGEATGGDPAREPPQEATAHEPSTEAPSDQTATNDDVAPGDDGVIHTAVASPLGSSRFPDGSRRVWVHEMIQRPWYQYPGKPYGSEYPLVLQPSLTAGRRPSDNAQRYVDSGLTGVQLLLFDGSTDVSLQVETRLERLDDSGVELAPCLYPRADDGEALKVLKTYVSVAASHPSAARITVGNKKKWVVFVYGTRYPSPSVFANLRKTAEAAGIPVFWVGDVVSSIAYNHGTFNPSRVEPFADASVADFLPSFDASWTFDPGVDQAWTPLVDALTANRRLFAGGMMPGYNRESNATGGYVDALATRRYRRQWANAISSNIGWNNVVSWNDFAERHQIAPTSSFSWTLADVTAFMSAKFRGVAAPARFRNSQLYVTTPERINIGQAARSVEALVLNGGSSTVSVTMDLRDEDGVQWGHAVASVPAGLSGAATVEFSPESFPKGRFVRARATTKRADGTTIQTVLSAPILVYGVDEQASGFEFSRTKYRSVAARLALPGKVSLKFSGHPVRDGRATVTVEPPSGTTVRFADVLQNNFLVETQFGSAEKPIKVPLTKGTKTMSESPVDTPTIGFYMTRVIDESERVGYSDPVYVGR